MRFFVREDEEEEAEEKRSEKYNNNNTKGKGIEHKKTSEDTKKRIESEQMKWQREKWNEQSKETTPKLKMETMRVYFGEKLLY